MDTLLIAVTALSLLMAAAMALVVMKLVGDERRRSDARVAALAEMAAENDEEMRADVAPADFRLKPEATRTHLPEAARARVPEAARTHVPEAARVRGDFRLKPEATTVAARQSARPAAARTFADLPIRAEVPEDTTDVRSLFDEPERSSPWGRRFAVIATIVLVVGGGGWILLHAPARARDARTQTAVAERAPLELMSLRHAQEGDRLTITGLVENPRTGAPLTRVVATAFAFGPDGTFLASGRAPIDFTSLGAGDESPFVVTIPVTGTVARYRVGFRAEDGTVIAHVDKRQEAMAQK